MHQTSLLIAVMSFLVVGVATAQQTDRRGGNDTTERVKAWLKQQDKNKDGKISKEEARGALQSNFDRVDANGDGEVTREELQRIAQRLGRNNRNRNRAKTMSAEQLRERAPEGVRVETDIAYREGDKAWKLDLAMPAKRSDKPLPAIVFIHGGGWANGDKRTAPFAVPMLQFAGKNYVTVSVNYRLQGPIRDCIEDVKCAVRWLRANAEKYNVDPQRIGSYGNSAGAHLSVMLAVSAEEKSLEGDGPWKDYSSAVQAAAAAATPTAPRVRGERDDAKLIAPMSYIRKDAPPLLLFHDASDRTVPVSNSDDFVEALKKAGAKSVTYKRYTNDTGHGVFLRNIKETGPALEAFFALTLKGEKPS